MLNWEFWKLFYRKWYFDILQNKFIVQKVFRQSLNCFQIVDKGFLEFFGPSGIFFFVAKN